MPTNKKVSVIIPFYNEYDYLENTIMSVLLQSYKNIEILVVDDSGVHGVRQALNKIKKDRRIRLLDYGVNRGVSAARNFGLDNATGDWIYFLDADDFISSGFIERCVRAAEFANLPVAGITRHMNIPDKHIARFGSNSMDFVIYPIDTIGGTDVAAMHHQYIYGKKFLDDNKIRFCDGLVFGEDLLFYLLVAHYAKFASLTGGAFYYFRAPSPEKVRPYRTQDCKKWAITKQKFETEYAKIIALYKPGFKHPDAENLIKGMTRMATPQMRTPWWGRIISGGIPVRKWRRKVRSHFAQRCT